MKIRSFIVLFLLTFTQLLNAYEIEGVQIPDSYKVSSKDLTLNGVGTRSKFFIDLYVGALYLPQKSNKAKEIIDAKNEAVIKLHIISSLITSKKMRDAIYEGFEKATNSNTASLQEKIDKFIAAFKDEIKKNDLFDLVYKAKTGVEIYKNGNLISTIKGHEFKKALFTIWLGEKPAQKSLKKELLNQ